MKKFFWIFTNVYGKIFGWPVFRNFHHAVVTSSLHALGYGNMYLEKWTGEERFLKNVLVNKNLKIIFDVGANVGNYSKMLVGIFDAEIHAFEPNPKAFEYLNKLPESVHKIQAAVSDEDGIAVLNYQLDTDGRASLDSNIRKGNQIEVRSLRLESYCKQNLIKDIDFLKIDTEGFEREVIKGLGNIRPRFIQFEFNINHLIRGYTVYNLSLMLKNYTLYRLLPNGWIKINPQSYIDNIFIFSNFVAVRND